MITARMDIAFGSRHPEMNVRVGNSGRAAHRRILEEDTVWQLRASLRFGDCRTPEVDVTPAPGIVLIVAAISPVIRTRL